MDSEEKKNTTLSDDLPPCAIYIDREGRWFHSGAEMVRREFIREFYRNMELDSRGRYVITWEGKRCRVDVADTAFVVWGVDPVDGRFVLRLSDDTREALQPETLFVGEQDVLYCRVRNGRFPARFVRPAYYQLAAFLEGEDGSYYLPVNGERYPIRHHPVRPAAGGNRAERAKDG